ncbi:MAG: DUF305 domain-containing protein [Propioniciclava sp.]|uniref:DUF305 domain-containing protein n=1 Tax=Propioniciclava sp. TaxID=2038686 RepID=UPI0039E36544
MNHPLTSPSRALRSLWLVPVTAIVLAGCSGAPATSTPAGSPAASAAATVAASPADVTFAQQMIGHHEQAVQMSDILLGKPGLSTEIKELATAIKDAQQPEIDRMRGWLKEWGQPEVGAHAAHDPSHGMLDAAGLKALQDADTLAATKLFLEGMIAHHEGAVAMAESVLATGSDPRVKQLAEDVVRTQKTEITLMQELLVGF